MSTVVASADVFADALVAGPFAARGNHPVLLTSSDELHAEVAGYLSAEGISHVVLMGGTAALSDTVESSLTDLGVSVTRLAGTTRYDTAVKAAELVTDRYSDAADDEPRPLTMSNVAEDPAWSPDCSRIVFSRAGSLWTMSNDGTDQQQLVDDDIAYSDEPAWSPDGTQIAFERLSGSGRDDEGRFIDPDRYIAVMTPIGSKPVILTEGGRWDRSPRWSPDGSRIAYISGGAVKVMSPDGTGERTVVTDVHYRSGLSWSPDGRMLAFARSDGESRRHLVAVEADGPDKYRLVEHQITDLSGWVADPRWSPDEQLIAITHYDQDGANIEIYGDRDVATVGIGWLGVTTTAPLKVQATYAVPHGGASTAGRPKAIADSVAAAQRWFRFQTGGRHPVFERDDVGVSVETVRLPEVDLTDGFDSGRALRQAVRPTATADRMFSTTTEMSSGPETVPATGTT